MSLQQFSPIIRLQPITLKPLSHILDGGDLCDDRFLSKWTTLLPTVPASALEMVLLCLVNQESLVMESEFKKHRVMLDVLLASIIDWKVLRRGVLAAADIRSSDVAFALLRRLCELPYVPGSFVNK